MDTRTFPLVFSEPHGLAPFVIVFGVGLVAACGWALLRPWPPRAWRVAVFCGVTLACVATLAVLLRTREVIFDPARREVAVSTSTLGWARTLRWPFGQVKAVVVTAPPLDADAAFSLVLRVGDDPHPVLIEQVPEVLAAETRARSLAALGPWPAVRSGYRLVEAARGGGVGRFETAAGRTGIVIDLGEFVRVVEQPGAESIITPLPQPGGSTP
ncbi:MAG: hypothetical protein ACT4P0_01770 [Panacagrimonas sp.]